jgi:hypothetical protein
MAEQKVIIIVFIMVYINIIFLAIVFTIVFIIIFMVFIIIFMIFIIIEVLVIISKLDSIVLEYIITLIVFFLCIFPSINLNLEHYLSFIALFPISSSLPHQNVTINRYRSATFKFQSFLLSLNLIMLKYRCLTILYP